MEKKFKCQSCGHEFIADTNKYVTCPNCESDNVALAKSSSPVLKIVLIAVAALVVIGGIVAAFMFSSGSKESDTETQSIVKINDTEAPAPVVTEEQVIEEIEESLPQEIVFTSKGTPAYDEASDSYSVNVAARVQGGNSGDFTISYTVTNLDGSKVITTSNTGNFMGLKPIAKSAANPEASYQFVARAMRGDKCVDSLSTTIPGFNVIPRGVEKMTIAEVQALIDKKASVSEIAGNPRLAENVRVRCQGDMAGAPTSLNRLIKQFSMGTGLIGARVVSLEYDQQNRVNCVVFTPIMSNE